MNNISYVEYLINEVENIHDKINEYNKNNTTIVKEHNYLSNTLNNEIYSQHKIVNESYDKIQLSLNYFFSIISQYNSFTNVIKKIKQTNNYYENKILINNKLLEKNNKIIRYISEIFDFCNYRDILQLISSSKILEDTDTIIQEDNFEFDNINEEKDINFVEFENKVNTEDNDNELTDEYYKAQLKYYSEIEDYIQKINIDNSNYDKQDYHIDFQVDKDIKIMKELINIIKSRANRNKIALKKYNDRILSVIKINNNLYEYLYNFSNSFKYFNIKFNHFFSDKIPKLDIINFNIDCFNQEYFENFYHLYKCLLSYSHDVVINSVAFSFELSKLKSYFNSLRNFFNINNLNQLLSNFEDKIISNDLFEAFQNINNKFDFIKLEKFCDDTIESLTKFVDINQNNIDNTDLKFSNLKISFYENIISKNVLKNDYRYIIYQIIMYVLNNNVIEDIKDEDIKKILYTNKYINNYKFKSIINYLNQKNNLVESLSKFIKNKDDYEEDFIKLHQMFEIETNSLQYLLSNNSYEANENIIEKNKQVLNIETKIKVNIENLEASNIKISDTTDNIRNNKTSLLNEIINIIKYHT
jgi:hypothetical protein